MTDIAKIEAAAKRIAGRARRTPLLNSPFLDKIAGRKVFVKSECLQHTGSFKFRGAWSAVSALTPDVRKRGVIAYSSGNHAQGVAYAAREHGIPAVIIMPSNAPRLKIDNTRALGAEVVLYDRSQESREEIGKKIGQSRGLTLIKPYDNSEVIAGQGTTGLEIAQQAQDLGITSAEVLVCCGGGGLTAGIALALEACAPEMRVRPVEPEFFDDTLKSLAAGHRIANKIKDGGLCDAILTPEPGELTFPILQRLAGSGISVSDDQALSAMAMAFQRLKIVAEPGGAVALAAALFKNQDIQSDTIIAVITGGNVDHQTFSKALKKLDDSSKILRGEDQ